MADALHLPAARGLTPGQSFTVRKRKRFIQLTFRAGLRTRRGLVVVGEDRRGRLHYVVPDAITHVEPSHR